MDFLKMSLLQHKMVGKCAQQPTGLLIESSNHIHLTDNTQ